MFSDVLSVRSFCGYSLSFGCLFMTYLTVVFRIAYVTVRIWCGDLTYFDMFWMQVELTCLACGLYSFRQLDGECLVPFIVVLEMNVFIYFYDVIWVLTGDKYYAGDAVILVDMTLFYILALVLDWFTLTVVYSFYDETVNFTFPVWFHSYRMMR